MTRTYHFERVLQSIALFFLLSTSAFAVDIASSPNDYNDDSAAIKAAILTATNGYDKVVRFQAGAIGYLISEPIVVSSPDVQLKGIDYGYSTIIPTFGSGPAILMASPRRPFELLPSLATGPGQAMSLDLWNFLYASDAPSLRVDGLSQLTVECFLSGSENVDGPNVPISSQGILLTSKGVDSAFRVMVRIGNVLQASFTDTTGFHEFFSKENAWTNGTHHIALQYDNGNAYLFLDGQVVASYLVGRTKKMQSPTLVQQKWEEVMIGGGMGNFPYGGYYFDARELDALDGVHISNVVRYPVSGFPMPTTKPVRDMSSLLLCNFDFVTPEFVRAETNMNIPYAWLTLPFPAYTSQYPTGQIGNIGVRNIQVLGMFGASGIYCLGTIGAILQNVATVQTWQGVYMADVYFSRIEDVGLGSQRMSLAIASQGEAVTINRAALYGGYFPFAVHGAVGGPWSNILLTPQGNTVASALLKGGDMSINGINVDDEGNAGFGLASIIIGDFTALTLTGGQILNYNAHPTFYISGVGQGRVQVNNTAFFSASTVPYLFFITQPRQGLVYGGAVNWNNATVTNEASAVNVSW